MKPQIFCLHSRWDYSQVAQLMHLEEKPVYFSILRDPVSLFISVWDYYDIPKRISDKGGPRWTLEKFAQSEDKPNVLSWAHLNFRDVTLFDFGLKVEDNDNLEAEMHQFNSFQFQTFGLILSKI